MMRDQILKGDKSNKSILDELKNEIIEKIRKLIIKKIWYDNIKFNCELRTTEGYMINRSLNELAIDITNKIKNSSTIIHIDNDIPFCTNIKIIPQEIHFEERKGELSVEDKSEIMKIINKLGGHNKELIFVLFTIVNLNVEHVNEKIPYVNINNLDYYLSPTFQGQGSDVKSRENNKIGKINYELEKLSIKLNKIDEYRKNFKSDDVDSSKIAMLMYRQEDIKMSSLANDSNIRKLMKEIDTLNSTTIIGSIELSAKLKSNVRRTVSCSTMDLSQKIIFMFRTLIMEILVMT
jgi:hypothetical protein